MMECMIFCITSLLFAMSTTEGQRWIKAHGVPNYKVTKGDCTGNDIQHTKEDVNHCAARCEDHLDCVAFVFVDKNVYKKVMAPTCLLKNSVCETTAQIEGVYFYVKTLQKLNNYIMQSGNCFRNDLDSKQFRIGPKECGERCDDDPFCGGYNYGLKGVQGVSNNFCFLKSYACNHISPYNALYFIRKDPLPERSLEGYIREENTFYHGRVIQRYIISEYQCAKECDKLPNCYYILFFKDPRHACPGLACYTCDLLESLEDLSHYYPYTNFYSKKSKKVEGYISLKGNCPDYDIKPEMIVDDEAECANKCDKIQQCRGFVYEFVPRSRDLCYLKGNFVCDTLTASSNMYFYTKTPQEYEGYQRMYGDCNGGDIACSVGTTPSDCKRKCDGNLKCKGFVTTASKGLCCLKEKTCGEIPTKLGVYYFKENPKPVDVEGYVKQAGFCDTTLMNFYVLDPHECAKKCDSSLECLNFVFFNRDKAEYVYCAKGVTCALIRTNCVNFTKADGIFHYKPSYRT